MQPPHSCEPANQVGEKKRVRQVRTKARLECSLHVTGKPQAEPNLRSLLTEPIKTISKLRKNLHVNLFDACILNHFFLSSILDELGKKNLFWTEAKKIAPNRVRWTEIRGGRLCFLNNDLSQTSPCNIKGLSASEVLRIENMITQMKFY